MHLLVVVPCLNEEQTVGAVLDGVPKSLPGVQRITKLVVDDGSTDCTAEVAQMAGAVVVSHQRNLGYGTSFRTALEYALSIGVDVMVHIDGDGQFDSRDIAALVTPITDGAADLVLASRFLNRDMRPQMPVAKYLGNLAMSRLLSTLLGRRFYDVSCGFRAYSLEALLHLDLKGDFSHSQETVLDLAFKGLRIVELPVHVQYFANRVSRIADSLPRYAFRSSGIILRAYRDYYPLRFFNATAAVLAGSGALFAARLFNHYASTGQFYGEIWSGAIGGFLLLLGALCFVSGLLAHMIDRNRILQERVLYMLKRDLRERRSSELAQRIVPLDRMVASHRRHTPPTLRIMPDENRELIDPE